MMRSSAAKTTKKTTKKTAAKSAKKSAKKSARKKTPKPAAPPAVPGAVPANSLNMSFSAMTLPLLYRQGPRRAEPLEPGSLDGLGAAAAGARLRGALRPLHGRPIQARDEVSAVAARQGAGEMLVWEGSARGPCAAARGARARLRRRACSASHSGGRAVMIGSSMGSLTATSSRIPTYCGPAQWPRNGQSFPEFSCKFA